MSLTVNLYYTGKDGNARKFAEEMESSGTADRIRAEKGNLRYEYFIPLNDPETVLLIDSWADQEGIQPCFKADQVLSGTGAGDTSIAAFLLAAAEGKSPEQCAALAAAEGACAVTAYDALGGLKPLDVLEARIASGWETM